MTYPDTCQLLINRPITKSCLAVTEQALEHLPNNPLPNQDLVNSSAHHLAYDFVDRIS